MMSVVSCSSYTNMGLRMGSSLSWPHDRRRRRSPTALLPVHGGPVHRIQWADARRIGRIDGVVQRITPYLLYSDVGAAIEYLDRVFGFRETLRFAEPDGRVSHAEVAYADGGEVMLGDPGDGYRSPAELGGATQMVHVYVDDVDTHYETARRAGAVIERELADQPYG